MTITITSQMPESKNVDVATIIKAIAGTNTPIVEDEDGPIMRVKRGDRWVRVINLVDRRHRAAKMDAIAAAHEKATGHTAHGIRSNRPRNASGGSIRSTRA